MKKLIALLLFVSLVFSLCACGASDSEVRGETNSSNTTAPVSENEETEEPYELSLASGNTYTNKYFGFGCTLGDGWTFSSEEEMKEMNGIVADAAGDEYKELLEKASLLYELSAVRDNGDTVGVNIENVGVAGLAFSEKSYLEAQTDALKETLENSGVSDVVVNVVPVDFAGGSHYALSVTGTYQSLTMEEYVIAIQRSTRFANVAVCTFSGNLDELLSCFYAVD